MRFSRYFGANSAPLVKLADVLGAVDDLEVAALVEEAGVAGVHPAVRRLGLAVAASFLKYLRNTPGLLNSTSPLSAILISTPGPGLPTVSG